MRVLFITQKFPYPLDNGGNVRSFNLLRGLSQQHEITLLSADSGDVQEEHLRAVRPLCRAIELVRVGAPTWLDEGLVFARSLSGGTPFVLLRHTRAAVHERIRALFSEADRTFEAVHFNHLDAALYEPDVPQGIRRILDEHNVVTNQVKTTLRSERRVAHRLVLNRDLPRIGAFEQRVCNRMDLCLVCSDADMAALRAMGVTARIAVIPNGSDLEYFAPRSTAGSELEMAFVGALDYDPCEKGVWYFCTEILPLIRAELPGIRFTVIGRNPSRRLLKLSQADPAIVTTGRVADVRPHVQRAGAFVVPLLSGSGTRLKIIEAMAMGVPVISTTIGAEGLEARGGLHLEIADRPGPFAQAVVRILRDGKYAQALARSARELVVGRYGWDAICGGLVRAYPR